MNVTVKSNELSGAALDWAVARCEGLDPHIEPDFDGLHILVGSPPLDYFPSTNWAQAGVIIDRLGSFLIEADQTNTDNPHHTAISSVAEDWHNHAVFGSGDTILISFMRCYVASRLGDYTEIPDELLVI